MGGGGRSPSDQGGQASLPCRDLKGGTGKEERSKGRRRKGQHTSPSTQEEAGELNKCETTGSPGAESRAGSGEVHGELGCWGAAKGQALEHSKIHVTEFPPLILKLSESY